MAFGGVDFSAGIGTARPTAASSGNTSSPAKDSTLNGYLIGLVLAEALLLAYGRRIFRNYHGG